MLETAAISSVYWTLAEETGSIQNHHMRGKDGEVTSHWDGLAVEGRGYVFWHIRAPFSGQGDIWNGCYL